MLEIVQNEQGSSEKGSDETLVGEKVSERKRKANRENAQKSTGPRTASGKAHSRQNALKYGLFAKHWLEFLRFGEDEHEFEQLAKDLREDFQPIGRAEELEVDTIISCWWKSKRAERFEVARTRNATNAAEYRGRLRQRKYCRAVERKERAFKKYLKNVHQEILATDRVPKDFESKVERYAFKDEWLIFNQQAAQHIETSKKEFPDITPEAIDAIRVLFTIDLLLDLLNELPDLRTRNIKELTVGRHLIPEGADLEVLLRFRTANQRTLEGAMDRLEQLQNRRKERDATNSSPRTVARVSVRRYVLS